MRDRLSEKPVDLFQLFYGSAHRLTPILKCKVISFSGLNYEKAAQTIWFAITSEVFEPVQISGRFFCGLNFFRQAKVYTKIGGEEKMTLINTRIGLSLLSIAAALAIMAGATFAFFSDVSTSSNNVFSTGTLDLVLSDADESGQQSVTASFGGSLTPNTCTGAQTLFLRNDGTIAGDHAEVTVGNVINDSNNDANPDMHSFLRINSLTYDGVNVTSQITDVNTNGHLDLADWAAGGGLDNLGLTNLGSSHPLVMDICLDDSAGNTIQGDSVTSTFTVTLNQDPSQ